MTSTKLFLTYLLIATLFTGSSMGGGGSMPSQWWTKCKARQVSSFNEYKSLIEGEFKDKIVFVDFFME